MARNLSRARMVYEIVRQAYGDRPFKCELRKVLHGLPDRSLISFHNDITHGNVPKRRRRNEPWT